MKIIGERDEEVGETAVTIGVYDGVHRGHRRLLCKLREVAEARRLSTALVTFDPHPLRVLRPVAAPCLLTDIEQRLALLSGTGLVDTCMVVRFDKARSEQDAEHFVHEILIDRLRARHVVVGADFRFGHNRAGDVSLLTSLGEELGFSVTGVPLFPLDVSLTGTCSSTFIRKLVRQGEVDAARRLLLRPHEVSGVVVATAWPRPGRGVPNVVVRVAPDRCLPLEGAYAGFVIGRDARPRAGGIVVRPRTPGREEVLIDVHVLDRPRELMERRVRVEFTHRIWSNNVVELYEYVRQSEEEHARAQASCGWASAI